MSWSCTASCNGRVLVRLSILSTDMVWRHFLDLKRFGSKQNQVVSQKYNLHSITSRQVVGVFIVQTPHLCLQDLLPTSACQSNQLTYFSLLISRQVVGVFIVQTPHLCLQDLLPTSACRDILKHSKKCRSRQSIDKSPSTNDLTANMPTRSETKHITWIKNTKALFDALDFTSAAYQPSDHCRTSVQAQHVSLQKIQELNTDDLSFILDGVLSTLQQGSAENGVGSPAGLRYHVKKRRAQICDQIQRFIKIPTGLRRQTRTSNTHTKQKRRA